MNYSVPWSPTCVYAGIWVLLTDLLDPTGDTVSLIQCGMIQLWLHVWARWPCAFRLHHFHWFYFAESTSALHLVRVTTRTSVESFGACTCTPSSTRAPGSHSDLHFQFTNTPADWPAPRSARCEQHMSSRQTARADTSFSVGSSTQCLKK